MRRFSVDFAPPLIITLTAIKRLAWHLPYTRQDLAQAKAYDTMKLRSEQMPCHGITKAGGAKLSSGTRAS